MDVKEEQTLGRVLDDHWYYLSKGMALKAFLRSVPFTRILDIGAGSGIFSKLLLRGNAVSATCVDPAYDAERSETFNGKPLEFVRAPQKNDADLVLLMDVLEHVDDDVALLRSSATSASPNAYILITVPAFQSLFSAHDRFLDHKRRYTLRGIEKVVKMAGLEIVRSRYFFGFLLPVAALMRMLQRQDTPKSNLKEHPQLVNKVVYWVHRLELPIFRINRLGGLTVFCLARKR